MKVETRLTNVKPGVSVGFKASNLSVLKKIQFLGLE